jgi:hypothetical protein
MRSAKRRKVGDSEAGERDVGAEFEPYGSPQRRRWTRWVASCERWQRDYVERIKEKAGVDDARTAPYTDGGGLRPRALSCEGPRMSDILCR